MEDEWIILKEINTDCQKITLHKSDWDINGSPKLMLTCDNFFQFMEGEDEELYHKVLTAPVSEKVSKVNNILVLGGGDYLAVRDLVKLHTGAKITLVDYDKGMTDFCSSDERVTSLNEHAYLNCKTINADALEWVPECKEKYDVIIVDFPDPTSDILRQLYSKKFINQIINLLNNNGGISIQCNNDIIDDVFWKVCDILNNAKKIPYEMPYMGHGTILVGVKRNG